MNKVMLMIATLALVLATATAQAQRPGDSFDPDFDRRIERMAEQLDLTTEQSEQLQSVFEASAAEHEAIREKIDEQFGAELCALRLATEEQVNQILTAEQQAELAEIKESRGERAKGKGRRGHTGPKGDWLRDCEPQD